MKNIWITIALFIIFTTANAEQNFSEQDQLTIKVLLRNSSTFISFLEQDITEIKSVATLSVKHEERYSHSGNYQVWIQGQNTKNKIVTLKVSEEYTSTMCQAPNQSFSGAIIKTSDYKVAKDAKPASQKLLHFIQVMVDNAKRVKPFFENFASSESPLSLLSEKPQSLPYIGIQKFTYSPSRYFIDVHGKLSGKEFKSFVLQMHQENSSTKYKVQITTTSI